LRRHACTRFRVYTNANSEEEREGTALTPIVVDDNNIASARAAEAPHRAAKQERTGA
jgi:hypothetical protein